LRSVCAKVLMGDDERQDRDVGGPGRIREIRLDMLRVTGPGEKKRQACLPPGQRS
jgi:hypothetical protein